MIIPNQNTKVDKIDLTLPEYLDFTVAPFKSKKYKVKQFDFSDFPETEDQ